MLSIFCMFLTLLGSAQAAKGSAGATVTPLQKVVELLEGMVAKGKAEKQAEEVEHAKYSEWCAGTKESTTKSIKKAGDQIEQLTADIAKAESDADVLAEEVTELEKKVAETKSEMETLTAARKEQRDTYLTAHTDFSESIDAIKKAIQVLKARSGDVKQSAALLQEQKLPVQAKAALSAFLQLRNSGEAGAPEANAYEFQSGGVIAMLEKLEAKFVAERSALEKEEMNGKHNYELLMQQKTDDLGMDESSVSRQTAAKAERLEDAAAAKSDKDVTTKTKAEDEETLQRTTAECTAESEEFEANQKVRAEELATIKKAISILSSDAVKGNAETYLPSAALMQVKKATALAQLRSGARQQPAQQLASAYLQAAAKRLGSRFLSTAAMHTGADPFEKVKQMIKDLLVKLMEEANAEASKNGYCTTELATNKMTREDKSAEVEELSNKIDAETAKIAELTSDTADLSDAVAELRGKQAEATSLRAEEKKTNEQTIADAKEAQIAVERAIAVLKDFYGTSAAAMIQQEGSAPYTGMTSDSTGVLGMLEVVLSDFARLETETSSAEDAAERAQEKFMDESTLDITVKEKEIEHKTSTKDKAEAELRDLKKDIKLTQGELDAAMAYYDKLKPECVDNDLSYEDRKVQREEEIKSLKEALAMLEGEELAL